MIKHIILNLIFIFTILDSIYADPSKGQWKQFVYTDGLSSNYIFDINRRD